MRAMHLNPHNAIPIALTGLGAWGLTIWGLTKGHGGVVYKLALAMGGY